MADQYGAGKAYRLQDPCAELRFKYSGRRTFLDMPVETFAFVQVINLVGIITGLIVWR